MAIRSQGIRSVKDGSDAVIGRSGFEYKWPIQKFRQKLDENGANVRTRKCECSMKNHAIYELRQEVSRLSKDLAESNRYAKDLEKTIRKLSRRNKKLQ